jgi:hypothetical protein
MSGFIVTIRATLIVFKHRRISDYPKATSVLDGGRCG